ncbi:MAG: hypothetical protein SAL07_21925 [Oscillatoria sp. PMC 1051.18]|uniref:hypothetical protein n=1 Tax=Oscillatoria salina TaxID=331517 RepID=UPI0013BA046C|nr:hypothetical protein [Oscillatoria salina]MBZ8180692.1 hypothetical protein [Oscillatoria salina IIICB1]MEC4895745.1 hypothetical protein [Oscillatoria sp. PMC 1050.18]MEC5032568.1 hypothetical protein [Oscillatoria sp. PMC 1051.18]NET91191.1 hypothetical protein [Kamptonema sp. SIO1D9]
MNQDLTKLFQINVPGLGCWLTILLIGLLLGSVGLGWVVNGFLIVVALLLITPAIAWYGFSFWVKRNLVEDQCPVCNYEFTGFNRTQCRCPNCGEALKVEQGQFLRLTPPGTIDVEAVEVAPRQLED